MEKINLNRSEGQDFKKKTFPINSDKDLIEIRNFGRTLAAQIGFNGNDQTLIATALSEICRNVIEYAGKGEVRIEANTPDEPTGIRATVIDNGPGIKNIEMALQEGYSTGKGLGIGMPGAKRIMDEFIVESETGKGTTVRMSKRLDNYEF